MSSILISVQFYLKGIMAAVVRNFLPQVCVVRKAWRYTWTVVQCCNSGPKYVYKCVCLHDACTCFCDATRFCLHAWCILQRLVKLGDRALLDFQIHL